jgi:hypothetical protein
MKNLYILLILFSSTAIAQDNWDDYSGEQKAFYYNISRRTEIINPELFHLFEFTDSIPYINDTLPNHKYVEREIVKSPEKLLLHADQFARKPNGLISDLATHFAIWELDAALKFRNSDLDQHKFLKPKLEQFEKYVLEKIPQSAVQTLSNNKFVVRKAVKGYYEPALQTADKMAALLNSGFTQNDQMLIVNSIARAEQKYISIRSYEIFKLLGGQCEDYMNYVSAAGDGSGYSSLEGGKLTPYNKTLPDDKGLFGFNVTRQLKKKTYDETRAKRPKPDIYYLAVDEVISREFKTRGNKNTVVHFDVYGYHPERQTTVVIQKGGSSYILYGKNEHRLISPDSTYGEGTTYWRLLWELENVHIAELNEALYGKKGYEYWIDVYEKRIVNTELRIKKTEYRLNKLRMTPEGKPKIKKKKFRKKDLETSDQSGTGHPTSKLSKNDKKKNIEQNRLNHLNTLLENEKAKLKELKYEMEKAYFVLQDYKTLLDEMQKNLGYLFMEYEQDGDIFTFTDGTVFNYATQDFTFVANNRKESYRIVHIAFGKTVFAKKVEESFIHMNLSSVDPKEKYTYQKIVAQSESKVAISSSDSIQIMEIFRMILDKDLDVNLEIFAGGIMAKDGENYFRDSTLVSVPYEKDSEENNEAWKYRADWDTKIHLSVEVWQDKMLPFEFDVNFGKGFLKLKKKYPQLTEIDFTSAKKAQLIAWKWVALLKSLADNWFEDVLDRSKINRKLNSLSFKEVKFFEHQIARKIAFNAP